MNSVKLAQQQAVADVYEHYGLKLAENPLLDGIGNFMNKHWKQVQHSNEYAKNMSNVFKGLGESWPSRLKARAKAFHDSGGTKSLYGLAVLPAMGVGLGSMLYGSAKMQIDTARELEKMRQAHYERMAGTMADRISSNLAQ